MASGVVVAIVIIIILILAALFWSWWGKKYVAPSGGDCSYAVTMASLWATRSALMRETITETFANSPGLPQTLGALQNNQRSIAANFSTRYGKDAGEKYASLLQENVTLASQIADSSHSGRDYRAERDAWYQNAQEIAAFLRSQNSEIGQPQMTGLLSRYQDAYLGQINDFAAKNYPGALERYRDMAARGQEIAATISSVKKI